MKKIKLDQLPKNATATTVTKASSAAGAASGAVQSAGKWWKILIAALMLAYIVLPTDFLPDIMPVVGWVDDALAAVGMIVSAVSALKNRRYDPDARMEQRANDIFGDKD